MLKNTSSSISLATKLDVSCYFCAVPPNHAGSSKSGLSSLGLCGFGAMPQRLVQHAGRAHIMQRAERSKEAQAASLSLA
ncbi:hypothetical protein I7I48_10177 [Histoplasma ohiense]|nr:hypothetical protein I7I48_10177 [Histoplasma ohiense (nom. inval.)]